jgi:nucleoside 2-deoxyribosyltransferase
MNSPKPIIYCSGPLFCPEEIGGMTAIANALEAAGYATFVPHRDGLEYYTMGSVNLPVKLSNIPANIISRLIFALDLYQIVERCDGFVMNFNGRVPDEGAVAEAGIAYASGLPMIIYKNDVRSKFNGVDNGMVTCLSHAPLVSRIDKIPAVLGKIMTKAEQQGPSPYQGDNIPPVMRDTVALGRKVWQVMQKTGLTGGEHKRDAELIDGITKLCAEYPVLIGGIDNAPESSQMA